MPVINSQQSSLTSGTSDCTNSVALFGIEAQGQQVDRDVERPLPQLLRIADRRQRVQVGDEIKRLFVILQSDVLADRAEIIAPVDRAGRLDAAEYAHNGRESRVESQEPEADALVMP